MKFTTKERQLIKEYTQKLINKRIIKEDSRKKLKLDSGSDWESVLGFAVDNDFDATQAKDLIGYITRNYTERELTDAINNWGSTPDFLLPSFWCRATKYPYPGLFARALNASKSAEPLTDLWNIFYAKRNLSAEARAEFKKAIFKTPKHPFGPHGAVIKPGLDQFGDEDDDFIETYGIMKIPETKEFFEKFYPQYLKK